MTLFSNMKQPDFTERFLAHHLSRPSFGSDPEAAVSYLTGREFREDLDRLSSGCRIFDLPVKKQIPKTLSNKKRTVYCYSGRQKLLLQAIAFALHAYDDRFPDCVYSSILKKNFKEYIKQLKHNAAFGEMYAVKADIKSYGSSIDVDMLVEKLRVFFQDDPSAFDFFRWLLERRSFLHDGKVCSGDTSALPGIPIHSFFTNLYLLDMDLQVRPVCTGYCRYSDDILAFAESDEEARHLMDLFREKIIAHKLRMNEARSFIFEPHSRIDHMGISFQDGRIDISDYSLYKLKRKMRIRAKRIRRLAEDGILQAENGARQLARQNLQTFFGRDRSGELCWSRWLFPMLTEHDGLHELDLHNQRCIRYVLSGTWRDSAYRFTYKDLKDLGYSSLVRSFYGK